MEKIWQWIVLSTATVAGQIFFRVLNRLEVEGKPERFCKSTIFYANHRSFTDPFVILLGCRLLRPLDCFLGRSPAVRSIAWGGHLRGWRRHLIKPARIICHAGEPGSAERVLGEVSAALEQGENILIFPEGGIYSGNSPTDLARFAKGLAWLAKNYKVNLQPVALLGAVELLPPGSLLPRIGRKVKVVFGNPIPSAALNGKGRREINLHLEEGLKKLLAATL